MKIMIGSDHRGFRCKQELTQQLVALGHTVQDVGCDSEESCDYPDFAEAVACAVADGRADRGVLVCGTGIGMSITANKVPGVRAALCLDEVTAEISRKHNNANVLCLAGDIANRHTIGRMAEVWLATEFDGGRHERRLGKVREVELKGCARLAAGRPAVEPEGT